MRQRKQTKKVLKVYCACPQCEATDSISVMQYRTELVDTPLILVFDPTDRHQVLVPVFDRGAGDPREVWCLCANCKSELALADVVQHNEKIRSET